MAAPESKKPKKVSKVRPLKKMRDVIRTSLGIQRKDHWKQWYKEVNRTRETSGQKEIQKEKASYSGEKLQG